MAWVARSVIRILTEGFSARRLAVLLLPVSRPMMMKSKYLSIGTTILISGDERLEKRDEGLEVVDMDGGVLCRRWDVMRSTAAMSGSGKL